MHLEVKDLSYEEWKFARSKGVGGSDASAILNMNPYMTRHDVWLSKVNPTYEVTENKAMKIGKMMEPVLHKLYEEETGLKLASYPYLVYDAEYPELLGNIDRYVLNEEGDFIKGVELKTTSSHERKKWEGDISLYHYCQVQHYMRVLNQEKWDVMIYLRDIPDWYIVPVDRNDKFINGMVEEELRFWREHVEPKVEPELELRDVSKLKPVEESEIEATVDIFDKVVERYRVNKQLGELKKQKEELDNEIKLYMKNSSILVLNGKKLATFKSPSPSYYVKEKILEQKYPEIFNELKQQKNTSPTLRINYKE